MKTLLLLILSSSALAQNQTNGVFLPSDPVVCLPGATYTNTSVNPPRVWNGPTAAGTTTCTQQNQPQTSLSAGPGTKFGGLHIGAAWIGNNYTGNPYVGLQLYLWTSIDGAQWKLATPTPLLSLPAGTQDWFQDTAIVIWYPPDQPNGVICVMGDGWATANTMHYACATDLRSLSKATIKAYNPSVASNGSPYFFVDPATNKLYMTFQGSSTSAAAGFIDSPVTQTYAGMQANTWTGAAALTTNLQAASQLIDLNLISSYTGSGPTTGLTYYLFGTNYNTGTANLAWTMSATASSPTGPFTFAAANNQFGFTAIQTEQGNNRGVERTSIYNIGGANWEMMGDVNCGGGRYVWTQSTSLTAFPDWTHTTQPSGLNTWGQGVVAGCAASSYPMRAGQFQWITDPVWIQQFQQLGAVQDQPANYATGYNFRNPIIPAITTVSSLPTCGATSKGQFMTVTDATSPTYNATLTGGGAVAVPVFCDGTSWKAH